MTRKVSTRKSAEERRAEAEQLHETITEQIEALRDSETWTRFLAFAQAFHRYSLGNLLLRFAQCPEATQVAGYRTWQSLHRPVPQGGHGIQLLAGRASGRGRGGQNV